MGIQRRRNSLETMKSFQSLSYDELQTTKKCSKCGKELRAIREIYETLGIMFHKPCDCVLADKPDLCEDFQLRQRQIAIERLFSQSELGPRFRNCTLDMWIKRPGSEKAFEIVSEYLDMWPQQLKTGEGIVIFGPYGNGKSHLAAACVNAVLQKGYPAIFQPVTRLMYRLNASYRGDGPGEAEIIDGLIKADLVVLDDVGAEKWSEKVGERLYSIIDGRYWGMKPIIMTGNFRTLGELQNHIGGRAFDRLLETCTFVENTASSYRMEKASLRVAQVKIHA